MELLVGDLLVEEKIGQAPFSFTYIPTSVGAKNLVARATYTDSSSVSSSTVSLNIVDPNTITVAAPTQNQQVVLGSTLNIVASVNTTLGSVRDVNFYANTGEDDSPSFFEPPQTSTNSQGQYVQSWTPSTTGIYTLGASANYEEGC